MTIFRSLGHPTDPDDLELALRRWYPSCVVRPQERLAALNDAPRWYVFRDGSLRPRPARSERLYDALARSRDLIASSLHAVDRAATSPGVDRSRVGRKAAELHRRFDDDATIGGSDE